MEQNSRLPIFRERLRILMGDASNTEFAKTIGISRQTLGFYLNGDRIPDCETLIRICTQCNVSSDWLLGLSGDASPCRSAVDELGLSQKAVDNIRAIPLFQDGNEMLAGLNMVLEGRNIHFISSSIKNVYDLVQCEKEYIKRLQEQNLIQGTIGEKSQLMFAHNDDVARAIGAKINEMYPELAGRFTVSCGQNAMDARIREIVESFDTLIKIQTGYFDVISFALE